MGEFKTGQIFFFIILEHNLIVSTISVYKRHVHKSHWSTALSDKKVCVSFLRMEWSLFVKTWFPFTKGCFALSLVLIVSFILLEIFKCCQCILTVGCFINIISSWKGHDVHLNKLEFLSLKKALCQVLLILADSGYGEEDGNVKSLHTDGSIDRAKTISTHPFLSYRVMINSKSYHPSNSLDDWVNILECSFYTLCQASSITRQWVDSY